MNLPNKLTVARIFLSVVVVILLAFPFYSLGFRFPIYKVMVNGAAINISLSYILAGVIFVVASLTDFLDGYIARKYNLITDLGKMLDSIADKILVNAVLIIFASNGYLSAIVPVIIITRDTIVNALKMDLASKGLVVAAISSGKIKTFAMMIGLTLMFFSNMPFEFFNLSVDNFLIYFATIMSIVSMLEYIRMYLKAIKVSDKK